MSTWTWAQQTSVSGFVPNQAFRRKLSVAIIGKTSMGRRRQSGELEVFFDARWMRTRE